MLRESIGETLITFNSPDESLRACIRRTGELYCPEPNKEMAVPSGPDWIIVGATGTSDNLRQIRGSQGQELQPGRKYVFDIGQKGNSLTVKLAAYEHLKKAENK